MRAPHLVALLLLAPLLIPARSIAMPEAAALAQQRADELLAADRAYSAASARSPGLDGLMAQMADDVIVPVPGKGLAIGKPKVIEALQGSPAIATARIDWSPIRVGISADGNQGFSFGFMDQHQADGSTLPYKYLAYWHREAEGWKVMAWKRGKRAAGAVDKTLMPPLLPATFAPDGEKPRLDAAERAFSDEAQTIGLGPAFAKFGSADSINLGGPDHAGFVIGAEAIAQSVSEGQPAGGSTVNWSADRVVVAASGDLGVSLGHIRLNEPASDGSKPPVIPFFTVWRRAAANQPWRYVAE